MGLREDIIEEAVKAELDYGSMFNPLNRYENYLEEQRKKDPFKDDGDPKLIKND